MSLFKHHEFWNPKVFEIPLYIYLAGLCLRYRVPPTGLAKANSALDHGEIGIGSKFHTQQQFSQSHFLPTEKLDFSEASLATSEREKILRVNLEKARAFSQQYSYPIIFKPDIGMVGKGILKIGSEQELEIRIGELYGQYLLQQFTALPAEFGVFYMHYQGKSRITGVNQKHFPTVVGNGKDTIATLARQHDRYTQHWDTFLQYVDQTKVLAKGQEKRLSFIGSHTMGCKFTDDSHLVTPQLEHALFKVLDQQEGFNYGRLDVKTKDAESLKRGEFTIIEVNGISSLPTHMFDPKYSLLRCYKILLSHGRYLVKIARENNYKSMHLLPFLEVLKRVRMNQNKLDELHESLKSRGVENVNG